MHKSYTYEFICPECSKTFRTDEPGEPCCTGPSESSDDHPMVVMRLAKLNKKEVSPIAAQLRVEGALLLPFQTEAVQRDAEKILHG